MNELETSPEPTSAPERSLVFHSVTWVVFILTVGVLLAANLIPQRYSEFSFGFRQTYGGNSYGWPDPFLWINFKQQSGAKFLIVWDQLAVGILTNITITFLACVGSEALARWAIRVRSPQSQRLKIRFHLSTMILLMLAGGGMILFNMTNRPALTTGEYMHFAKYYWIEGSGWPCWIYYHKLGWAEDFTLQRESWLTMPIWIDVSVGAALLLAIGLVCEWRQQAQATRKAETAK